MLDDAEDDDGCLEDEASLNERRLVSRYGVWLLVGLCTPEPDTPMSTFGHMLSMLFQVKEWGGLVQALNQLTIQPFFYQWLDWLSTCQVKVSNISTLCDP